MLKFNAGRVESRMATLLGFGFSEANLVRMMDDDPVVIKGSELGVEGCNFVVFYSEGFQERFGKIAKQFNVTDDDNPINVMYINNNFFLTPIVQNKSITYFIGLDNLSYKKLREGKSFAFRMRIVEGEGDNIEILMFWGQTEKSMQGDLSELELVGEVISRITGE